MLYLLGLVPLQAVATPILRHIGGFQGVEVNAGIASIGQFGSLAWSYYFSSNWQIKVGVGGAWAKQRQQVYKAVFAQPVLVHTLLSNYRNVFLNVFGGTSLLYESFKRRYNANVGVVLGGELAVFVLHRIELLLGGGGRLFFLKSPYGYSDYFLGVGVRYSF